jgi:hypothetical protein
MLKTIDRFHRTVSGHLVFGLAELAAAYGLASLSIDRGNLWWYLLTLIFLVGALQNFVKLTVKLTGGLTHVRRPDR